MIDIVLAYSKKTSVTGKALFNLLKTREEFSRVRRVLRNKKIKKAQVFVRLGNSSSSNPDGCIEINSAKAVRNASDKKQMLRIFKDSNVSTVEVSFLSDSSQESIEALRDSEGGFFVRDRLGVTRYDTVYSDITDSYISKPVDKDREYRVHVFDGKIIGAYEKIPREEGTKLFKSSSCKFNKVNLSLDNSRVTKEAQALCTNAVNALGLTFGGVDLLRERGTKRFIVSEVNSSPGLNTIQQLSYVDNIIRFIEENENDFNTFKRTTRSSSSLS